jgi:hypothetical protein
MCQEEIFSPFPLSLLKIVHCGKKCTKFTASGGGVSIFVYEFHQNIMDSKLEPTTSIVFDSQPRKNVNELHLWKDSSTIKYNLEGKISHKYQEPEGNRELSEGTAWK